MQKIKKIQRSRFTTTASSPCQTHTGHISYGTLHLWEKLNRRQVPLNHLIANYMQRHNSSSFSVLWCAGHAAKGRRTYGLLFEEFTKTLSASNCCSDSVKIQISTCSSIIQNREVPIYLPDRFIYRTSTNLKEIQVRSQSLSMYCLLMWIDLVDCNDRSPSTETFISLEVSFASKWFK